jgi:G protein-coupled receptor GPR1
LDFTISSSISNDPCSPLAAHKRDLSARAGLGRRIANTTMTKTTGSPLSDEQNRAILVAALVCASISLLLVLVTLRWFLVMQRCFRHRLILHLIISDTFKAAWYFVFPIVVFNAGPVSSTSKFCQASGFLLAFSIEASDTAIFLIAIHSTICILRPNNGAGEGGLFRYKKWLYVMWLCPPLILASLAFINDINGYVTAGTFCYLPKRPIWYRLALSWVPRYVIIFLILSMYFWIYVTVRMKFRGFEHFSGIASSYDSGSRRWSAFASKKSGVECGRSNGHYSPTEWQSHVTTSEAQPETQLQPWNHGSFATPQPMHISLPVLVSEEENVDTRGSSWSGNTFVPSPDDSGQMGPNHGQKDPQTGSRQPSSMISRRELPAKRTSTSVTRIQPWDSYDSTLRRTRIAIRRQVRYLFIYPLIYILVWSFPFASHALNYNNYYVLHPIFWLSVAQTVMLSIQAGMDGVMFSLSEKPWTRIDQTSKFSIPFYRQRNNALCQRQFPKQALVQATNGQNRQDLNSSQTWWEAEGRRRNDSVWLGTDPSLASVGTQTRSRSPHKRNSSIHFRSKSSEQDGAYILRQCPGIPEIPKSTQVLSSADAHSPDRAIEQNEILREHAPTRRV